MVHEKRLEPGRQAGDLRPPGWHGHLRLLLPYQSAELSVRAEDLRHLPPVGRLPWGYQPVGNPVWLHHGLQLLADQRLREDEAPHSWGAALSHTPHRESVSWNRPHGQRRKRDSVHPSRSVHRKPANGSHRDRLCYWWLSVPSAGFSPLRD